MKELLQFITEGGDVVRFHTRSGIRPNTDAHHSHGVAMIASILAGVDEQQRTKASAFLLMACLAHDLGEQKVGDVSAPAKRSIDGLAARLNQLENAELRRYGLDYEQYLTPQELIILKLADCFDGMLYCCREASLGNRNVRLIWGRYCAYAETFSSDIEVTLTIGLIASNMYEAIKEIYKEATGATGPSFDVFAVR